MGIPHIDDIPDDGKLHSFYVPIVVNVGPYSEEEKDFLYLAQSHSETKCDG